MRRGVLKSNAARVVVLKTVGRNQENWERGEQSEQGNRRKDKCVTTLRVTVFINKVLLMKLAQLQKMNLVVYCPAHLVVNTRSTRLKFVLFCFLNKIVRVFCSAEILSRAH